MNKLLVPTDFSKGSLKAIDYAIHLAQPLDAEINLIWVDNSDFHFNTEEIESKNSAIEKIKNLVADCSQKYEKIKIRYHIRQGDIPKEIANQARYNDVNFVVCGTHGTRGFEKALIGSNAFQIIKACECPVITARPNYRFDSASRIIVAPIDNTKESIQKVKISCQLAEKTDAELHILGLYTSDLSSAKRQVDLNLKIIENYIRQTHCKYKILTESSSNITSSTLYYAESVDADMIVIMTEQESRTFGVILGTYAKQMVNTSPIPVVSIKPSTLLKYEF